MPYETYVIKTGGDVLRSDRKHEEVARDITAVFEEIRKQNGEFIAAIPLADETANSSLGGHPDGALYIVADIPDSLPADA